MRNTLIAGNLKMNLNREAFTQLARGVAKEVAATSPAAEVLICPPFPLLPLAQTELGSSAVRWGGQNMHAEASGAFTGEVSAEMLRETGCTHVILGHSERRSLFGETDAEVREKAAAALSARLIPIVCVGETQAERASGATEVVLSRQMVGSLHDLAVSSPGDLVVAYEPVWAIGTGLVATVEQAQEAHAHLRSEMGKVLGPDLARGIRILYGGSVKPDNAGRLLGAPDIDGALVGGASLQTASFMGIVREASTGRAG